VNRSRPDAMSQTCSSLLEDDADPTAARVLPSGLNATDEKDMAPPIATGSALTRLPVATSHSLTSLSNPSRVFCDTRAMRAPSGLNAGREKYPLMSGMAWSCRPVVASQMISAPVKEPAPGAPGANTTAATCVPSGLKAGEGGTVGTPLIAV